MLLRRLVPLLLAALLGALVGVVPPAAGQDEATGAEEGLARPTGSATLLARGRSVGRIGFVLGRRGPLIHLEPIARLLEVELRVGPLGDSHTLVLGDLEAVLGPDEPLAVLSRSGEKREERIVSLSALPVRNATGLHVPLDFLQQTFGDELGLEFSWSSEELTLSIDRREPRELEARLRLIDQGRLATLEIEFSDVPRYRVAKSGDVLEIQLAGDRLLPLLGNVPGGSLVDRVSADESRIRIEAVPGAEISEPRLVDGSRPLLIVDVLRRAAARSGDRPAVAEREDERPGIHTIVLDPGHGGAETGAIGPSGAVEKELCLLMARSLRDKLERRLPVRVVLTRTGDFDVDLDARTALANRNQADLFVSLHLNSAFGPNAHGAETYFLSREASDRLAAEAAEIENRSGRDPEDPEGDLQLILWDLAQSFHLAESQRLANLVQQELNLALGLRDRGVKQAPFTVLMGARMPAVLVELGFLSNPEEERKLLDPGYREELVEALVQALTRFKAQVDAEIASGDAR